mgnify:FL=1
MSFNIKWEEFLNEGSKKSSYQGSPVEPDGKTTKRKTRERHNKRKTKTTFGMTEPFSRGEKDLLRSTSISNVSEQTGVPVNDVQRVLEGFFGEFDKWDHVVNEAAQGNITADTCRRMGFKTFGEFLKSIDAIRKAEKGSLYPERE